MEIFLRSLRTATLAEGIFGGRFRTAVGARPRRSFGLVARNNRWETGATRLMANRLEFAGLAAGAVMMGKPVQKSRLNSLYMRIACLYAFELI